MRISDWSSDVCSSDLLPRERSRRRVPELLLRVLPGAIARGQRHALVAGHVRTGPLHPLAAQAAVLAGLGQDVVDQFLVVDHGALLLLAEPAAAATLLKRGRNPFHLRLHLLAVRGLDLHAGFPVTQLSEDLGYFPG